MLAVDGFTDQKREKQRFKTLRNILSKRLKILAECGDERKFEKLKSNCLSALADWAQYADELPPTAGNIGLRNDLEGSFQDLDTDVRYFHLKPTQALKWLTLLQFGRGSKRLHRVAWQVWALEFHESFLFDIGTAKKHIRKSRAGTKQAQ